MEGSTALVSIRPIYAEKIISGEKRLEFRRRWTSKKVDFIVIYATSPVKKVVAIAQVGEVFRGSKSRLWELARDKKGGITRRKLYEYMEGASEGVALELSSILKVKQGLGLLDLFGADFHPPQSFRYLNTKQKEQLEVTAGDNMWVSYS